MSSPLLAEKDVCRVLEDAFRQFRWRWTHFRPAMNQHGHWRTALSGDAGWPDYFCVRGDRAVAIEAKSKSGKTTEDQNVWLRMLEEAGIEVYVVRPSNLDAVIQVLAQSRKEPT